MNYTNDGWTRVADVSSGKIQDIPLDLNNSNFTRHTFLFAWYKDEFGNISVHNIVYRWDTQYLENWFTTDAAYNSMESNGSDGQPNIALRAVTSGNWFTRGVKSLFGSITGSSSETVATRQIALIPSEPDFGDTSADVTKAVKKAKKTAKKATKKAKKSAKKNSKNSVEMKEVTITIPSIIENITLADTSTEVVDAVESTVSDLTSLGDAAVEQTEVEVLPEVQIESVVAQPVATEAAAPVQSEPVEIEVDEENSKAICIVFAVLLLAAGTAVFLITKKLLKRKK